MRRLEVLSEKECWQHLAFDSLGRVACTSGALPAIVPVTYTVSNGGGGILLRTDASSELARSITNSVVAFEVDQIDRRNRTGWSVMAIGTARATSLSARPSAEELLAIKPWVAGRRSLLLRLEVAQISGRRLVEAEPVR